MKAILLIILISLLIVAIPVLIYMKRTKKYYYEGYNNTISAYNKGLLGEVDPPRDSKYYLCLENEWWHLGAYDAYCKIKSEDKKLEKCRR